MIPGLGGRGGSLWDTELVSGVAFHPRKCSPKSNLNNAGGAGWVDGTVQAKDGASLAYRLYLPGRDFPENAPVLIYFHANAELCTDIETEIGLFYDCGFQAVLCPEFRGYAWGTGKPALGQLCPDAEAVVNDMPKIFAEAGKEAASGAPAVVCGRSLGAAAAVHVAKTFGPGRVAALLVESGMISILDLPMVEQLGMMMPEMLQMLRMQPEPIGSMEKLKQMAVPAVFLHGDRDEMIPVGHIIKAHRACSSHAKKIVRYPRAGHNDLRLVAASEYRSELQTICQIASGDAPPEVLLQAPPKGPGIWGFLSGAVRCIPGMRRCLTDANEPHGESRQ